VLHFGLNGAMACPSGVFVEEIVTDVLWRDKNTKAVFRKAERDTTLILAFRVDRASLLANVYHLRVTLKLLNRAALSVLARIIRS
jgi:hypothetical protein